MDFQGKRFVDLLLIPAIVILVGVAAFGLGRLSVLKEAKGSLVIHPTAQEGAAQNGTHD
ncbi:MAG: hypothetical protein G01um101456_247 [Parcubacteria group bacterium Gr01-1014_56]|nr:MAG: hypothetical protein G01um101456_247 [Parcubacteria group bacterium Gr01-1014_56]